MPLYALVGSIHSPWLGCLPSVGRAMGLHDLQYNLNDGHWLSRLITAGRLFSGGLARPRVRQYPITLDPSAHWKPVHPHFGWESILRFPEDCWFFHFFTFPPFLFGNRILGGSRILCGMSYFDFWLIVGFPAFSLFRLFYFGNRILGRSRIFRGICAGCHISTS